MMVSLPVLLRNPRAARLDCAECKEPVTSPGETAGAVRAQRRRGFSSWLSRSPPIRGTCKVKQFVLELAQFLAMVAVLA